MDNIEARDEHLREGFERRMRRRTRFMAAIAGLAVIIGIAPMVVLAASFNDVLPGNIFINDIDRVSDAGITSGCGNGNYCPSLNVTREQMAAFLARTGGRVGFDSFNYTDITTNAAGLATVTIKAGNVAGGTAFLRVTGTYTVATSAATGFPVTGAASLYLGDTFLADTGSTFTTSAGGQQFASGAVERVVAVPTGTQITVTMRGQKLITSGAGAMIMAGALTVEYIPFSEDGDNVLSTAGSSGAAGADPMPNVIQP